VATLHLHHVDDLGQPALKPYRTLRRRSDLEAQRRFVVEGDKVVHRLLQSRFPIESLLITTEWLERIAPLLENRSDVIEVFQATKKQIEAITGFGCYQGIKAMSRIVHPDTLESMLAQSSAPRLFVAMDKLANAENVGVIVRNAAAFGAQGILVGETSCSPFLTRCIRVSMGSVFKLAVVETDNLADTLRWLRHEGVSCFAAHCSAEQQRPSKVDFREDCCLVMGSENQGCSTSVLEACDEAVAIPMASEISSLNVSSAAAAFLYEISRQRGLV